jgi:UDP-N-acetylmuramyl tripeptide synthase
MRLLDSRRLRGANLQTRGPAAVAEVALDPGEDPAAAEAAWRGALDRLASALGWPEVGRAAVVRPFPGGLCLALPSPPVPLDGLYAATELNEWAIAAAGGADDGDAALEAARERITRFIEEDARPRLPALAAEAARREVPLLWDDRRFTLGMAARSRTWPLDELPRVEDVPWPELGRIPVALVTGTNGKTTSARLLARMATAAGLRAGHTSTDGVAIGERTLEHGDFTGGEGARQLLRHPDVELAVLETARGGILRRGLAVDRAEVALLTNVSPDHLGEFGVHDLATMARVKAVIADVVPPSGRVVVNAEDAALVALGSRFAAPRLLYAVDEAAPALVAHRRAGGEGAFQREGALWLFDAAGEHRLAAVAEVPIAFGGAARYNVANALGAAAAARALHLPLEAIAAALRSFDASANPGRGQLHTLGGGARLLADFGHNAVGLASLFELCAGLLRQPRGRLLLVFTAAGDRTDALLAGEARAIAAAAPDGVLLWETASLRRGREAGEVTAILRRSLLDAGLPAGAVNVFGSELEAVDQALAQAGSGDLVVVTPSIDREGLAARVGRAS